MKINLEKPKTKLLDLKLKDFLVRKYTKKLEIDTDKTVYDLFQWKTVEVSLKDYKTGEILYHEEGLEFPTHYSQNACDIIAQKYFKRANVPNKKGKETSLREVVHRMVKFWTESAIDEGLFTQDLAPIFYDEVAYMILDQRFAPNSPQWFNTGLKYYETGEGTDGHFYYDEAEKKVIQSKDKYSRTQASACFILSMEDRLLGEKSISQQFVTETRLFKHGSGTGTNYSNIRASGEALSGGGTSSGVLSFMKALDRNAGAIKSGGTCLAPYQKVYTERGAIPVKELAESNEEFAVISFDPPSNRFKVKKATSWLAGHKEVVKITTDKGSVDVTFDHPMKLSSGEYIEAGKLKEGMSLFSCTIDDKNGYARVGLKDGNKGKELFHRLIIKDLFNEDIEEMAIHHINHDKHDNRPKNLRIMTPKEHSTLHGIENVENGTCIFKNQSFSHAGEDNGMHHNSKFWKDEEKTSSYKETQRKIMLEKRNPKEMQKLSTKQRMTNIAYKLINMGCDISDFDKYCKEKTKNIGRIGCKKELFETINRLFGNYDGFLQELAENNHRVIKVESLGMMDVYDVEVQCPTLDDKSVNSGHNFLIWDLENESDFVGKGLIASNTRRAARMIQLDVNHPEILDFINWKSAQEQIVKDLGKMGYDISFDGIAYETVSGQNGNNSIRFSNKFMEKVEKYIVDGIDDYFELKGRVDNSVNKKVKVSEIWNSMLESIDNCGDPAGCFDDTFNDWHTCPCGEDGVFNAKYNRINSTNPCFRGDMRLLTTDGYKTFEELCDKEIDIINKDGDISQSKVWCSGVKEIYEVNLNIDKKIYCTKDHRFMLENGEECEAQNLKGKRILPYLNKNITTNKEFELYGFLQGDGDLGRLKSNTHKGLEINIGEKDYDVRKYFNLQNDGRSIYLVGFNDKLLELGFSSEKLPERNLPTTIHDWNNLDKISFLRGLYSANGSVLSNGRITLKSTCRQLIEDVKRLLSEFDIDSYITTNKKKNVKFKNGIYECKESYDLNVNRYAERLKFYNYIGFIQVYKMERLKNYLTLNAPKVINSKSTGTFDKVYDFTEPLVHWGIVEGMIAHNCAEYAFLDDTACNLASINIKRFYDSNTRQFDIDLYKHTILLSQIVLEATIHWGQFPVEEVARKTHLFRTTGLGLANTSALHLLMGHPYDSDEARAIASSLTSIMTGYSYFTSSLMAKEVGTFEKYDINKMYLSKVLRNHARIGGTLYSEFEDLSYKPMKINIELLDKIGFDYLSNNVKSIWKDAMDYNCEYGVRNAQVTVIAPTGTISFAMDCEATSIEPFFMHTIYKKLAGGGGMMIVNPLIEESLKNLGYNEVERTIITKAIQDGEIERCSYIEEEHLPIFDTANKCGKGTRYISPMGHILMMASITPTISGAISKTINLPKEATLDDISMSFLKSWELGCKGITVYKDGSKASQPLNSTIDDVNEDTDLNNMKYDDLIGLSSKLLKEISESPKRNRPKGILFSKRHEAVIDGVKLLINTAFYDDGKLAEIYIVADKEGSLIKGLLDSLSKLISKMIQYDIPTEDIIRTLKGQKYEPHGYITGHPYIKYADSISDLVSKILEIELGNFKSCQVKPVVDELQADRITANVIPKNYIVSTPSNTITNAEKVFGKTCSTCSSTNMAKNGTCFVCLDCGSTTGCS